MSWSTRVAQAPLPPHWAPNASSTWDTDSDVAQDAVLHGQLWMGGCPFHVQAIRVCMNDGLQHAVDPAFADELERLFAICDDARLSTVSIPGHVGEYVVVIYPHAD